MKSAKTLLILYIYRQLLNNGHHFPASRALLLCADRKQNFVIFFVFLLIKIQLNDGDLKEIRVIFLRFWLRKKEIKHQTGETFLLVAVKTLTQERMG